VAGANPEHGAGGDDPSRRDFIHIAAVAAAAGAAATVAWPLVDQMNPAGDTLALASVEFDLTKVELGQSVTIKWRGKPLFIRHRTGAEIAAAIKDDKADMRDPQTDEERHKPGKAEWLVLIGTCTHLGCVPTFGGRRVRRLVLSVPRLALRHLGAHPERSGAEEPGDPEVRIYLGHHGQDFAVVGGIRS